MSDQDITALILSEHEAFRRDFARLRELDEAALDEAWSALAQRLEVHAAGEEAVFYPHVVRDVQDGEQETEHALRDHNEIRDAAGGVSPHDTGSDAWWHAVDKAQETNAEHMAEEEGDVLPGFREGIPAGRREELGLLWLKFHEDHEGARGLSGEPEDPEAYVEEHSA